MKQKLRRCVSMCLATALTATAAAAQPATDDGSQVARVRSWIEAGRYGDAEREAARLVELSSSTDTRDVVQPDTLDLLVEALTLNGNGAQPGTLQLADRALRARDAKVDTSPHALARSVRNRGAVLFQRGEFAAAAAEFERASAVRGSAPLEDDRESATDLDHLALALIWTEQFDRALASCDRALALNRRIPFSEVTQARTLEIRGLAWQRKGDYPRAREDLEAAIAIREATGPRHPETARLLTTFGEQLLLEGELARARQTLTRAVDIAERTLRPGHPEIASSLRTLAIVFQDLGDLTAAKALRERALAMAEQSLGPDHPMVAIQLNDLANTLLIQGEYAAARPLYERALAVYERHLGRDHTGVTTAVYNLALLHASLGDLGEASRLQRRAIGTWERTMGQQHPLVARALFTFAQTLAEQGRDRQALPFYERAQSISERSLGRNHPTVARVLSYHATSLARIGQMRRASELSARAIGIWDGSDGREARATADGLLRHAHIQADLGDYKAAMQSYDRALSIQLPLLGTAHPAIAETQAARSKVMAGLGESTNALPVALEAEDIGRSHLRLTLGYLPERQALGYASKRPRGLDVALSIISEQSVTPVLDALIKGRSLIVDEIARRRRAATQTPERELLPLWSAVSAASQRLANLVIRGPSGQRPEQYVAVLDEARHEKEAAERALAEKSVAFGSDLARAEIGLEQVRAALPADSALISFVRYDRTIVPLLSSPAGAASSPARGRPLSTAPAYLAFVLRRASEPIAIPLGRADTMETLIAQWRSEVLKAVPADADAASAAQAERGFRTTGASLRRRIWDPVQQHIGTATRVYIVPDGAINLVPFAALPVGQTQYLLEGERIVHYLSSERDLVTTDERRARSGSGLLALGGPAFADGSSFAALASRTSGQQAARRDGTPAPAATVTATAGLRGGSSDCGSFQAMRFAPLPGTDREASDIAGLWKTLGRNDATDGGPSFRLLTGAAAHEQAFKQLAPGHRVLHLATHGFFLGDECGSALDGTRAVGGLASGPSAVGAKVSPSRSGEQIESPLLLSGLALAGANRRAAAGPNEDDGILTAEEVASLNLDGVEWAVLSACDTGLGEVRAGEGVFGLRRAFQVTGVRTTIMSLWSVEDRATGRWMRALYTGRLAKRLTTADAVREASLTALRERRAAGQSTHPFFWAAFVAAGDWN
jgi:CHAT domain-containing protein/tetratricopeptide (TPR) repeat protein